MTKAGPLRFVALDVLLLAAALAAAGACGQAEPRPATRQTAANAGLMDPRFRACPGQATLANHEMSFAADRAPKRIRGAPASYPKDAADRGVRGIVILEAGVDREGVVRQTRIVRSVPLLDDAAAAAVCAWRFTPALLSGRPIAVVMRVSVNFPP